MKPMAQIDRSPPKSNPPAIPPIPIHILEIALLVAFGIAAFLTAYLTFTAVRDFVTSWNTTSLPGIRVQDAASNAEGLVNNPDVPLQPSTNSPAPQPWDGASRVTVLLLGLDYRDWQAGQGPPRTDTMILLTIDPINRTAGMLSIPRDLWVTIPGFEPGKINTAYQLGEAFHLPDGGPGLAMRTVENLLGVPIDYYAQIDFNAFVRFVDELGGVKIDVPQRITIDLLGDNNAKTLEPGVQTLPGEWALAYARARHTDGGDFDRAQRQQQVILGIRERIVDFNMLPSLIAKSGILYSQLSSGVHTNLTLDQTIKLAWLASQIPKDKIKRAIIGAEQVSFYQTSDQLDVLKPLPDKVREVRDQIFTESGPASPAAAEMNQAEQIKAEGARVSVLNGTDTPGLAALTTSYLQKQGIQVTNAGNAEQPATYTEITFYTGKPYTVKYLVDLMKIDKVRIHHYFDPASPVDLSITLGTDWADNNPMSGP